MNYDVNKIFDEYVMLSNVHTKKDYESYYNNFGEHKYTALQNLVKASDVSAEAEKLCDEVAETFKKFRKIRTRDLMNLNYYMIYYVFPTILECEENGKDICDTIRDVWNSKFKSKINYTDYETLHSGFQTKIFGIPIGKN